MSRKQHMNIWTVGSTSERGGCVRAENSQDRWVESKRRSCEKLINTQVMVRSNEDADNFQVFFNEP